MEPAEVRRVKDPKLNYEREEAMYMSFILSEYLSGFVLPRKDVPLVHCAND